MSTTTPKQPAPDEYLELVERLNQEKPESAQYQVGRVYLIEDEAIVWFVNPDGDGFLLCRHWQGTSGEDRPFEGRPLDCPQVEGLIALRTGQIRRILRNPDRADLKAIAVALDPQGLAMVWLMRVLNMARRGEFVGNPYGREVHPTLLLEMGFPEVRIINTAFDQLRRQSLIYGGPQGFRASPEFVDAVPVDF